jgi:peptidoglycan/xylan/chitin deacetylase (PgdA/CDA1 family)
MRARSTTLILCYHGVSDAWEHALSVRPAALERQLRSLLFRRYKPVTAAEALKGGRKVLHVTFDDAFRNVANALPALERLRVPATVFACAAYAADGRPLQVPRLAEEVRSHPEHVATMTWDELRALAERGVEIGSHTLTHRNLPTLSDAELDRELRESRQLFETELGRPCRYLAYPWGEHDERIRAATRKAGYEAAFALRGGADGGDPYAVPRIDLYRKDHLLRAMLKTSFVRPVGTRLLQLVQAQKARVAVLS